MIIFLDASFIINVKKTDIHKYFHEIFSETRLTSQIEEEVVSKGLKYQKQDAILTKRQIEEGLIKIYPIKPEKIKIVEKVIHYGEASLISAFEDFDQPDFLLGTDDRVFYRYVKYVYPLYFNKKIEVISTLNVTVLLFQESIVDFEVAKTLLQQLEKVGGHGAPEIMEAYHYIEKLRDGKTNGRSEP